MELLLTQNADVNAQIEDGRTALMIATFIKSSEIIELLLAKGAEINAKDKERETALMQAAADGAKDIVELLLSKGADPTLRNKDGQTALMLAESAKTFSKSIGYFDGHSDTIKALEEVIHVLRTKQ